MSNQASLGDISASESDSVSSENTQEDDEAGFVEIPSDWKVETVTDVADPEQSDAFTDGDWVESSDMDEDGDIQLVQLGHLGEGMFKGEPDRFVNEKFAEEEGCTILEEEELMISRMQEPILRACLLPEFEKESIMAVDIARLRPKESWNKQFLKYLFNSRPVWKQGLAWASGTTRKRISRTNLGKIELQKPDISEQRRIASILYNVEQAIKKTEELLKQMKRVKKGLKQDILLEGIQNSEFETYDIGPKGFNIPSHWDVVPLKDIGDDDLENNFTDGDWVESADMVDEGEYQLIQLGNIGIGEFKGECNRYVSEQFFQNEGCTDVETGDLLISRMAEPIMRTTICPDFEIKSITAVDVVVAKVDEEEWDKRYLENLLNHKQYTDIGRAYAAGSTRKRISRGNLEEIKIPKPSIKEQKEIADILESADLEIESLKQEREHLRNLKLGLMQDLLTGEVRTSESVEVLDEVRKVEQ